MSNFSPESILAMSRNFMESRILLAGAELNLFTILTPTPLSVQEIARRSGGEVRALTVLLDALTAMGLLTKQMGQYHCPANISSSLSAQSASSVLPMVLHIAHLWKTWSNLTNLVKGAKVAGERGGAFEGQELVDFIGAMHVIAAPQAPRIVAAVHPGSAATLLDVGGASGTYTIAFLQAAPQMKATLFDRFPVIEMARKQLDKAGVLDRVTLVAGDFYKDELPGGHDLAFVSAIIHQNSPQQNLDLYSKVFRALKPGGRIVIRDHAMEADRTRPKEGAIFAVNMLVGTSGGKTYTLEEVKAALGQAGFMKVHLIKSGEHMDALVEAFKP
jgi:predicted O-methyltransferase YrrM